MPLPATTERGTTPSDRPRIAAIVLNSVNHDARVLKEADALAAAGFDMLIIGLADDRCSERETHRSTGVRIIRIDHGRRVKGGPNQRSPRGLATFIRRALAYRATRTLVQRELDRFEPHAVHCHDLPAVPIGAAWCARHPNARLIFDSHELYEEVAGFSKPMRSIWRTVLRRYAPRVHGFITINDSIAAEHARRHPALPRAVIVMNAAQLPVREPVDDGRLRQAAGLDSSERILLYQGGYSRHRGLEDLVRAAAGLPEGWTLVMMGWGGIEQHLRSIATKADPSSAKVRFIPPAPQQELCEWSAGATLGVIPYENTCLNHWFCTPNKLWEYPSSGVPVIASAFPELRRPIDKAGIGMLLPSPLNERTLHDLLASISPTDHRRMKAACRRFVETEHWEVFADRLVRAYREWLAVPTPKIPPSPLAMTEPKPTPADALRASRESAP